MIFLDMTGFFVFIFFGTSFTSFPCEGIITQPSDGTTLYFSPEESNAEIVWSFDDEISDVRSRDWSFTSSDGSKPEALAEITADGTPKILAKRLLVIEIRKPATLILKNVDQGYNGTYKFALKVVEVTTSSVSVFITNTPSVKVNCSRFSRVNKGDDFSCLCRGKGGNPPAQVTWYNKDNKKIGNTGNEQETLIFRDIGKNDDGTYRCEAKSHDKAKNETSIRLIVNFKPNEISIRFTPEEGVLGKSLVVLCNSNGVPKPTYTAIFHNGTIVSFEMAYFVNEVKWNDVGTYKCFAKNTLGNVTVSSFLTVTEPPITRKKVTPTTDLNTGADKTCSNDSSGTKWYIIVVTLVSGIIIGILISYIVSCSRKFKSRKSQNSNPEPAKSQVNVNTTYQELDLTKINTEDNYQSLARNDGANEDNSTYTQLSSTRDRENNYQSLT